MASSLTSISTATVSSAAERPPLAERIAGNERRVVLASIMLLAALAWGWTLSGAMVGESSPDTMGAMGPMGSTPGAAAMAPLLFTMWFMMMAAMMLPSAAPAILLYGRIRARHGTGSGIVPSWMFLAGYLLAWLAVSLVATLIQLGAETAGLLDGMAMRTTSPGVISAILIAAGLYQLTPIKNACLTHCRSPAAFLASHWRSGRGGLVRLGLLHGAYCVGCCWLLMLLLFVGGVMNMLWIVALSALVATEKLWGSGVRVARVTGALLMIVGTGRLLV